MIAVADLHSQQLLQSWHEGVAIVRELVDTLGRTGSKDQVPDLAHVAIGTDGEIVIRPGSPLSDHPVRQLATVLEALLEGTGAPPELSSFASENRSDRPKHASVEEFANALARFERPGRLDDIARVAARSPGVEASSRIEAPSNMESEISQLRARAQLGGQARGERDRPSQLRRWIVPLTVGGILIMLIYMGLAMALWLRNGQQGPAAAAALKTLAARLEGRLTDIVRSVAHVDISSSLPLFGTEPSTPGASQSPAAESAPNSRAERRGTEVPRRGAFPTDARDQPAFSTGAQPRFEFLPATGEDLIAARRGEAESGPPPLLGAPVVYTRANPGVVPPVMLRQYLPSARPDQATSGAGVFDIVVSETGEVERVRLISVNYPFHEKMLVAAVKAWRFRPALKEGLPVKYRVAVRITT